ncbi:MAG: hypothetical protein KF861_20670 [Planctomycetaceae bacterium]|nr:hypothetical protein [Planctomycetaceae bacterium]
MYAVPRPPTNGGDSGDSDTAGAVDPNEKFGATGYGQQGFIVPGTTVPYRINFENLGPGTVPAPDNPATAPAQRVEITDQLSADLDWSTFEFSDAGFGDTFLSVPGGRQYYFTSTVMTYNDQTFNVDVEFSFNATTGKVRVVFQSVDPNTSLPPDVLTGFLPPEDGTGRGKGHISFTIRAKADLPTGTEIRNVALISFDRQTIIATNQINPQDPSEGTDPTLEALNTIDAGVPSSAVGDLPASTSSATFLVSWAGADDEDGSGIADYTVFVSIDGGPFSTWLADTTETEAMFTGEFGRSYAFYSVARDNVGHVEAAPLTADAQTLLVAPLSVLVTSTSINGGDANRSGIRALTIEFDQAVTVTSAGALTLFNHATGQSVSISGATLVGNGTSSISWVLADGPGGMTDIVLPDGRYTAELAAAATTPNLSQTFTFEFHKLAGDVDGDGLVNFNDYFAVRENFDTSGLAYRPGDGDGDGLVNFNDYFAVRENFDAVLPAMTTSFAGSITDAPGGGLSGVSSTGTARIAAPPETVTLVDTAPRKLLSDRDDDDDPGVVTAPSATPASALAIPSDDPYESGKGSIKSSLGRSKLE